LNGEETKSPSQALKDARAKLQVVKSVHLETAFTVAKGATTFAADLDLEHRAAHLVGTQLGGHFENIVSAGKVYLKGDATFWKAIGQDSLGQLFGGQWVIPPPSSPLVIGLLALVDRANFPDCVLGQVHGTVTSGGVVDVGGRPGLAINDPGDTPGSAPSTVTINLVGAAYPVNVKQKGGVKAGGPKSPSCSLAGAGVTSGNVALSSFDKSPMITAPANAIDLALLGGGGPAPVATPTP